jgi:hypothetical protein
MDEAHRLILYKILHLTGVMTLFTGLAVLLIQGKDGSLRKPALIFHGVGLFLLLLSGFGTLRLIHASYSAGWVILKLILWLAFGAGVVLAKKGVLKGPLGWVICVVAGVIAASVGLLKPF